MSFETSEELAPVEAADKTIAYSVTMRYAVRNADAEDVLTGDVTFVAVYDLDEGPGLTDEELRDYAFLGVAFQVHPFLREHVATMCQRAGLTPYMLPPLIKTVQDADTASVVDS